MHYVHLQVGDAMVVVQSDEDDLETCVQAAHAEINWLYSKQRNAVFAQYR